MGSEATGHGTHRQAMARRWVLDRGRENRVRLAGEHGGGHRDCQEAGAGARWVRVSQESSRSETESAFLRGSRALQSDLHCWTSGAFRGSQEVCHPEKLLT